MQWLTHPALHCVCVCLQIDELYDAYCMQRRLRDGANKMVKAYTASSGSKEARESLSEANKGFKEYTEVSSTGSKLSQHWSNHCCFPLCLFSLIKFVCPFFSMRSCGCASFYKMYLKMCQCITACWVTTLFKMVQSVKLLSSFLFFSFLLYALGRICACWRTSWKISLGSSISKWKVRSSHHSQGMGQWSWTAHRSGHPWFHVSMDTNSLLSVKMGERNWILIKYAMNWIK